MSYSKPHIAAWNKWERASERNFNVEGLKSLTDAELTALAEDPNNKRDVGQERARRAALLAPPPPPQAVAPPRSALADLAISKGETFEDLFAKNRSKAAPVALVGAVYQVFDTALKHFAAYIGANSTKNRDRDRQIADIVQALGLEPSRPPLEERGAWTVDAMYYANDVVRRDAVDWRCLHKHRAATENVPGSDGAINHWEEITGAPSVAEPPGASILERLATIERSLGITPPEPR
jgi:hypothetical protein